MADSNVAQGKKAAVLYAEITDPTDVAKAILSKYTANQIGANGADSQIMNILIHRGHARRKNTSRVRSGFTLHMAAVLAARAKRLGL